MSEKDQKDIEQTDIDMLIDDDDYVGGYTIIGNDVMRELKVTDSMFRIYCILRSLVNQKKAVAFPSMETLGAMCGSSERTARRIVRELEKVDLIEILPRNGRSNLYKVKKMQNSKVLRNEVKIAEFVEGKEKKKGSSQGSGNDPKKEDSNKEFYKSIIAYFVEKTGKKVQMVDTNFKYVKTVYDGIKKHLGIKDQSEIERMIKRVIDFKTIEWKGNPNMDHHLHPKTIFRWSNFLKYSEQERPMPRFEPGGQTGQPFKKKQTVDDVDWDNLIPQEGDQQ